jgi:hypothetical protein
MLGAREEGPVRDAMSVENTVDGIALRPDRDEMFGDDLTITIYISFLRDVTWRKGIYFYQRSVPHRPTTSRNIARPFSAFEATRP